MVASIGTDLLLDGTDVVHVQDRNLLTSQALVGQPDENDIIWDPVWVDFDRLAEIVPDTERDKKLS